MMYDKKTPYKEVEAPHGQKMVKVTIKFWTNGIAPTEGMILPKHIHDSGEIRVTPNEAHGISGGESDEYKIKFKFRDLDRAIQELFQKHNIVMHY